MHLAGIRSGSSDDRIAYGNPDIYELAAVYAEQIATAHNLSAARAVIAEFQKSRGMQKQAFIAEA